MLAAQGGGVEAEGGGDGRVEASQGKPLFAAERITRGTRRAPRKPNVHVYDCTTHNNPPCTKALSLVCLKQHLLPPGEIVRLCVKSSTLQGTRQFAFFEKLVALDVLN